MPPFIGTIVKLTEERAKSLKVLHTGPRGSAAHCSPALAA